MKTFLDWLDIEKIVVICFFFFIPLLLAVLGIIDMLQGCPK